tara:strand:+ start:243 stop:1592 length:1350 start_codon:yes stop_codon:yes gene_type:complete
MSKKLLFFFCFSLASLLTFVHESKNYSSDILNKNGWGASASGLLPSVNSILINGTHKYNIGKGPLVKKPNGSGFLHKVSIRKEDYKSEKLALPVRSVAYQYWIALVTALDNISLNNRSYITYNFKKIIVIQDFLLLFSWLLMTNFATYFLLKGLETRTNRLVIFFLLNVLNYMYLGNRQLFTNGITDSALAPSLWIISLIIFTISILKKSFLFLIISALSLGFTCLIRGELVFPAIVGISLTSFWLYKKFKKYKYFTLILVLLTPVLINGTYNKAVFKKFVPFRMQSGQNLLEPIGQCRNPWGIKYSDKWFGDYMKDKYNLPYLSFQTDSVATKEYLRHLSNDPFFFVSCYKQRLINVLGTKHVLISILLVFLIIWFKRLNYSQLIPFTPFWFSLCGVFILPFLNSLPRIYESFFIVIKGFGLVGGTLLLAELIKIFQKFTTKSVSKPV